MTLSLVPYCLNPISPHSYLSQLTNKIFKAANMPLSVLVSIYPRPTRTAIERIQELTPWLTEQVKQNEPWISLYEGYSTPAPELGEGAVDFMIYLMCVFTLPNIPTLPSVINTPL